MKKIPQREYQVVRAGIRRVFKWIDRSKYMPHQNKRECERRVRQQSRHVA